MRVQQRLDALAMAALAWIAMTAAAAPFAYVTFDRSTVTIVDVATDTQVGSLVVGNGSQPSGNNASGVAVNLGGTRAYVSCLGDGVVTVIDTTTNSVVTNIPVDSGPRGIAINPAGTRVYTTNVLANTVDVIDTATNTLIARTGVVSGSGIVVDPSGASVYVASVSSNTVSVIDTTTNSLRTVFGVGTTPVGIAIHPAGTHLYVANFGDGTVSVVNPSTGVTTATIPVLGAFNVALNPSGTRLYVTSGSLSTVAVVDTATNAVIATIPVAGASYGVNVNPSDTEVYVTNPGRSLLSIISTATNTVINTIPLGVNSILLGVFIGGPLAAPTPAITLAPASLTFAARTLGTTSAAQTVTLTNNGPGTLNVASITTSGDFAFTSTCSAPLAQRGTCTIDVTFTPIAAGARSGSLTIASNAVGSPHGVALAGTGQPLPVGVLEAAPNPLQFDAQPLGTTSAPLLITLTNSGTATLNRGPESVDGDFRLLTGAEADAATGNKTCGPSIAAGGSCSLALVFTPTALGARVGAIALPNDGSTPVVTVHLLGSGIVVPVPRALRPVPQLLSFGDQPVGTHGDGKTVTITNTTGATVSITELSAAPRDFSVSETCATVAAHASCSPLVTFQPTAVGPFNGTLTIRTFSETDPYTVQLTGNGVFNATPALEVTPTRIGFGNVLLGGASTLGFTLRNIGLVPVVLGAITGLDDFMIVSDCHSTLEPGASCQVRTTFFPHTPGVHAASVAIFSNAANSPHHIDLSGVGCAIPTTVRPRVRPVLCGP